jgi:cyanate permease
MMILEGLLPFLWLPIWWFFVRDHPREAKWISVEEKTYLETTLQREARELEAAPAQPQAGGDGAGRSERSAWPALWQPAIAVMLIMYFFQNFQAYGCMTFFPTTLQGKGFDAVQYGVLFAIPYAVTAVLMILNSWHSDKTRERRGHVALAYGLSGICLILSVILREHFWISYFCLCLSIQGPFAGQAPFWAIPTETMPGKVTRMALGLVNAFGNLGGFAGPYVVGWLMKESHGSVAIGFGTLGMGMVIAAMLAFLLPKAAPQPRPAPSLAAV